MVVTWHRILCLKGVDVSRLKMPNICGAQLWMLMSFPMGHPLMCINEEWHEYDIIDIDSD